MKITRTLKKLVAAAALALFSLGAQAADVAQIGSQGYGTLQAAINDAADGATIELLSDVGENLTLSAAKTVTIDLANHNLTSAGYAIFTVSQAAKLTVKNGTVTGYGHCVAYMNYNNVEVTFKDVAIIPAAVQNNGNVIQVQTQKTGGKLTIDGGSVKTATNDNAGAALFRVNNGADVKIDIKGNAEIATARTAGAFVFPSGTTADWLTINSATINIKEMGSNVPAGCIKSGVTSIAGNAEYFDSLVSRVKVTKNGTDYLVAGQSYIANYLSNLAVQESDTVKVEFLNVANDAETYELPAYVDEFLNSTGKTVVINGEPAEAGVSGFTVLVDNVARARIYSLELVNPKAAVVKYATFQDALANAAYGATITLTRNMTIDGRDGSVWIFGQNNLTINGANKVVTAKNFDIDNGDADYDRSVFVVENSSNVLFEDVTINGSNLDSNNVSHPMDGIYATSVEDGGWGGVLLTSVDFANCRHDVVDNLAYVYVAQGTVINSMLVYKDINIADGYWPLLGSFLVVDSNAQIATLCATGLVGAADNYDVNIRVINGTIDNFNAYGKVTSTLAGGTVTTATMSNLADLTVSGGVTTTLALESDSYAEIANGSVGTLNVAATAYADVKTPPTATITTNNAVAKKTFTGYDRYYGTFADAFADVPATATELFRNLADVGAITMPAGATLQGNNFTISGNSSVYVNAAGGTVTGVNFANIHNQANQLSALYASNLTGTLTVTGCSFTDCDWDAIQATPVAGATVTITGNTFTESGTAPQQQRFVHVQSAKNVDFTATVTDNIMYGDTYQGGLEVYYFTDAAKINVTGNYIEDKTDVCILSGNGDNVTQMVYPMRATPTDEADTLTLDNMAAVVKDAYIFKGAYATLSAAFAAATTNDTIMLLNNLTLAEEIDVADGRALKLDMNGKTITLNNGNIGVLHGALNISGNGTIAGTSSKGYKSIYLKGSTEPTAGNYSVLTIGPNVKVTSDNGYAVMISANGTSAYGVKVTVDGTIEGHYAGLYVNGSIQNATGNVPEFVVNGTVRGTDTTDGEGIYAAGYAKWSFGADSLVTGYSSIYARSGDFSITNGTFTAMGALKAYVSASNGCDPTGDALILENTAGYGPLTVSIAGGKFESANAKAVAAYAYSTTADTREAPANFITGGSFKGTARIPLAYCGTGVIPVAAADGQGYFTVASGVVVTRPVAGTLTYTGAEQTGITAVADRYAVASGTDKATAQGTYTAMLSLADKCIWDDDTFANYSFQWSIARKAVTVTADAKDKIWGNADPAFTATVAGTNGTDGASIAYNVTRADGEAVGTYKITPAGDANQGNYAVTYVTGTFTIGTAVAKVVSGQTETFFASFESALAAAKAGDTIVLLEAVTTSSDMALTKSLTLDLNGKLFTVAAEKTMTLSENLTVVNSVAGQGGIACNGTLDLAAGKTLDATALVYGQGGLIAGQSGTVKVAEGANLKLMQSWASVPVNYLLANNPTFITPVNGAVVTLGGKSYTWNSTVNMFTTAGEVARTRYTYGGKTFTESYASLADAINAVADGGTITMVADVDGAAGISVPSGKNFTVDFANHTYLVGNPGAGSPGTATQAFQLLKDSTIVFKNGTIGCTTANKDFTWTKGDSVKGIAILIQNYANLTLQNMTIDGTNIAHNGDNVRYVLSNNCGTISIEGSTSITACNGDVAFDVYKDQYYTAPVVTLNTTGTITGDIELAGGMFTYAAGTINGEVRTITGNYNDTQVTGFLVRKGPKNSGKLYTSLAAAIADVDEGSTLTMLGAVANAAGLTIDTKKTFTLDFNGYTYTLGGDGAGSVGTKTIGFQILQDQTVTFTNGTINCSANNATRTWNSDSASKGIAMLIQNYANLTLTGMTVDGSNIAHNGTNVRYVMSNNSGDVLIDNTIIKAAANDFAFDTCKYADYAQPTVEVKGTSTITGKIGLAGGNLTLAAGTVANDALVDKGVAAGTIKKGESLTGLNPAPTYFWSAAVEGYQTMSLCAARIGDTYYPTFAEAVDAAQAGNTVEVVVAGTYTLPNVPNNITIAGAVEGVKFEHTTGGTIASIPDGCTFSNVTFELGCVNYHGFAHAGTINMNGCTINGKLFSYGDMNFTECTFNAPGTDYCMWDYGGDLTYTNCVFNAHGKVLNVDNESNVAGKLTLTECTFNSDELNKSAINIKETCGNTVLGWDVTIKNCHIGKGSENFFPTDKNGGSQLWMVDDLVADYGASGVKVINNETDVWPQVAKIGNVIYTSLEAALTAAQGTGATIEILRDSNETPDHALEVQMGGDISLVAENPVKVTIAPTSKESTVDTDGMAYIRSVNAENRKTFTVGENVKLSFPTNAVGKGGAMYVGYSSTTPVDLVINGRIEAYLPYVGALSTMTVSKTGSLKSISENLIVRWGATVDVIGTEGNWTAANPQVELAYASQQGGVVTFKDTFVKAGAWWGMQNRNGMTDYKTKLILDNTVFVAGGFTGSVKWAGDSSAYAVELKNNSTITINGEFATLADGVVTVEPGSVIAAKSFSNAGKVVVDVSKIALNAGPVKVLDYTGNVTMTQADFGTVEATNGELFVIENDLYVDRYYVAQIGDTKYETLADAIEAATSGQTVKLMKDLTTGGITISNKGTLTIDFNGKDCTFDAPGAGSAGTKTNGFQILADQNVTFTNGTIVCSQANKTATWNADSADSTSKGIATLIQNYANLTLTGMTINGENIAHNGNNVRYVMSNNSGSVVIDNTIITAAAGDYAFDTCKYSIYEAPTVEVKGTSTIITGKIGLGGGNLTLTAGTVANDALVDDGIGEGIVKKDADGFTGLATLDNTWVWYPEDDYGYSKMDLGKVKIGDKYYAKLDDAMKAAIGANDGVPVELLADIDGSDWTSVELGEGKTLCIEGHSNTVSRLTAPLINKTGSGGHVLRISNITFKNADISSNGNYAAVILPYADCMKEATFTNVEITGAKVTSGNYAAAFVAYAAGYNNPKDGPVFLEVTFNNCTVTDSVITGGGSTGALMGHAMGNAWTKVTVEGDTVVAGNTIIGETALKTGVLFGTVGVGQSNQSQDGGIIIKNVAIADNTTKYGANQTPCDAHIFGRIGSTGGTIAIKGGSFEDVTFPAALDVTGNFTIAGGAFDVAVPEQYCAYGFIPGDADPETRKYSVRDGFYYAQIGSVKYDNFNSALAAAQFGDTIVILKDVTNGGVTIQDKGTLTIDFNGHAYVLDGDGAGSPGTKTIGFQILQGQTVTFTNGTINCSTNNATRTWTTDSSSKGIAMLIQNYANLTLTGMTVDGTNIAHNDPAKTRYVMSNNCGSVVIDNTTITAAAGDFAFDICKYGEYAQPTVEVKGTSAITGKIGLGGGNLTLTAGTFTNATLVDDGFNGNGLVKKDDGITIAPVNSTYFWSTAVEGYQTMSLCAARIGEVYYPTVVDAATAAVSGDTITLVLDAADVGTIILKKDVILEGADKTLSGNSSVYVNAEGGTVQNVKFENIHNNANQLSAIYASNLSGKLTVTGCSFTDCDWDAIQVTPVAGAEVDITGNTFTESGTDAVKQQRFVHVESAKNVDFSATITNNDMIGDTVQGGLEVYYFADSTKVQLSGNYIEDRADICILSGNGTNVGTMIYPMRSKPTVDVDDLTLGVAVINDTCTFRVFDSLAAAVAAASAVDTITLTANASGAGIFVNKDNLTFDFGGFTYKVTGNPVGSPGTESQGFHIEAANCTLKNGTLTSTANSGVVMLVQNYSNLSLIDMTLDGSNLPGSNRYVLSNNQGNVSLTGNTSIVAKDGDIGFDSCKYGDYATPTVTVNTTGTIDGVIELSGGKFTYTAGTIGTVRTITGYNDGDAAGFAVRKGTAASGTLYAKLSDAVVANGDTLTVLEDHSVTNQVAFDKEVTLDLNGKTVSYSGTERLTSGVIAVKRGGKLTIDDLSAGKQGKIFAGSNAYQAVAMTIKGEEPTGAVAELVLNNGTLEGYYYAISGNGTRGYTAVTINGGTVTATAENDNLGIYNPQGNSTVTINGGTITGYSSAIEMRGGSLTVTNGTLTATAPAPSSVTGNGDGTTTIGAAIAIAPHTTQMPISVNITGGTFTGNKAIYDSNPQGNQNPDVTMSITGGDFTGAVSLTNVVKCISGGRYSVDLADAYLVPGYYVVDPTGSETWYTIARDGFLLSAEEDEVANVVIPLSWIAQNVTGYAEGKTDAEVTELLLANSANDVPAWMNYVMGLKGTANEKLQVSFLKATDSTAAAPKTRILFNLTFNAPETGCDVQATYKLVNAATGTVITTADAPDFTIAMPNADGITLYTIKVEFTPKSVQPAQ